MSDSTSAMPNAADRVDERTLSRLKWRCRRGLLENDLFVERFFARQAGSLDTRQATGLAALMELADNDLLDLLLARREPSPEDGLDADAIAVMRSMRTPPNGDARPPRASSIRGDERSC